MKYDRNRLLPLEIALMLALALTAVWGAWSLQRQDALEGRMIRLHVIANSDNEADQALKLQVRDRVLALTEPILAGAADREQAMARLAQAIPTLESAAAEEIDRQGFAYTVTARLEKAEVPHKTYDGFALPAGEYTALRVVIGEGRGRNWWCVVYPPLCANAATNWSDTAIAAGLGEDDVGLMAEEDAGYVLKFRSVELWETLRRWLGK